LLWARRRSLLDQWLIVALCALLLEILLASVLSAGRYNLAWYAGRFYQLVTATVVMVVLLAEMAGLYAGLARSNTMLRSDRAMLQRAIEAQRRERSARLVTGDAVAATIAHEVRQPLTAMVTSADAGLRFLERSTPNLDKAKDALRAIVADGHRAGEMVRSIRENFRSDVGDRTEFDVDDLIREALDLCRGALQKHGVAVQAEQNDPLPTICANRVQLQQVLLNLITNGAEAMATVDRPRILSVKAWMHDGDRVSVSVADTGAGIDTHLVAQIFVPLYTTKTDGMGMGLSICRAIIEAHEGRLWFSRNTPHGAVFHFTLHAHRPVSPTV
jgi:C4-dicarboxylate-specific signal transduction histidine kinase